MPRIARSFAIPDTIRTAHVLGTGSSLDGFILHRPPGELYGVNDIDRWVQVDTLVIQDRSRCFRHDWILDAIVNTKARRIFSPWDDWNFYGDRFFRIRLAPIRSDLSSLGFSNRFPHSNNSPFLAAILATMDGCREIVTHGVDLVGHEDLGYGSAFTRAVTDWMNLRVMLDHLGTRLCCSSPSSALSSVLHPYAWP